MLSKETLKLFTVTIAYGVRFNLVLVLNNMIFPQWKSPWRWVWQRQQRSRPGEFEAWEPRAVTPLCPPAVSQPLQGWPHFSLSASGVPPSGAPAGQAGGGGSGNQSARVMEPKPLARSHIYYRSTRPIDCHSLALTYISNKYNLVNHTNTTNESWIHR